MFQRKQIKILGAGISGLVAGITLAKNSYKVEIFEKRPRIGSFFKKSIHSVRNYFYNYNVIEKYKRLGIDASNFYPIFKEFRYSPSLSKSVEIYSRKEPLFYNFIRGYDDKNSLDNELLKLAKDYGVDIYFDQKIDPNNKNIDIVATGAYCAKYVGYGAHYRNISNIKIDSIYYFSNNHYAPEGYIYILPFLDEFSLVITTTKIKNKNQLKKRFDKLKKDNNIIKEILKDAEFINEIFGIASFGIPRTAIKDGKLYIGEAAGFLDATTGFGIHYAIFSGYLAAKAIINNENYDKLWKKHFEQELKAKYSKRINLGKIKIKEQEKITEDLIKQYGNKISIEDYKKIKRVK